MSNPQNEFAQQLKDQHTAALVAGLDGTPYGKAMLSVIERKLERVRALLRKPGENDKDWTQDVRWLTAQERMLEDLLALPQAAREKTAAEGDG